MFEVLLTSGEKMKLLSKLYKILSMKAETLEKVKLQWKKDLAVTWLDEE